MNPLVISSLQSHGFSVSVLVRATSTVEPPPGVTVYRTDYSISSLVQAFKDQDAVVNTITMPDFEQQKEMIDAAVEAGVKRFIPAEFGIDTSKEKTVEIMTFLQVKPRVIQYLRSIEDKITWTGIITGAFFDWYGIHPFPIFIFRHPSPRMISTPASHTSRVCVSSGKVRKLMQECLNRSLSQGFFSFNIPARTAFIHQPGYHKHRFSWSNLTTVAEAVSHVLLAQSSPTVVNRYVHVRSFNASQDEILQSLISATARVESARGQEHVEWKVTNVDLEEKVVEAYNKLAQGDTSGFGYILSKAIYNTGGNYDEEGVTMNEKLGMKLKESLDDTVEREIMKLLP